MFLADTNVYVDAAERAGFRARFEAYALGHDRSISSVVLAELALGFTRLGQMPARPVALAPSAEDWTAAAAALTRLERPGAKSRSFWNDALLAAQCSRLGLTLITSNPTDFSRLRRELPLKFVAPFPE